MASGIPTSAPASRSFPLTKQEFYRECHERGFLGKRKETHGPSNYTSMDGAGTFEAGNAFHNGNFHVEPLDNVCFQKLVARALAGGVPLSISQRANEPLVPGGESVFPFFLDIDIKNAFVPDAPESRVVEVCNSIFNIVQPMFSDEVWSRHMMDQRQTWHDDKAFMTMQARQKRLPQFIEQRWPSFTSICDVLTAFRSNPHTLAEQPPESDFTLYELFCNDVAAQNWLSNIVAAAIAHHVQKVVRNFYPDLPAASKHFDILALASINGTSEPSTKIGAHMHMFNLNVTAKQMIVMASAVENALVKIGGALFVETVDLKTFSPNNIVIRMPFTWKAEEIAARKSNSGSSSSASFGEGSRAKRPRMAGERIVSDSGKHFLINKQYRCAAYLPAKKNGQVDLESAWGKYLCILEDVLLLLQATQIRLSRDAKPTDGFTFDNIKPAETYTPASILPTLLAAGFSQKEAEEKRQTLLGITSLSAQQNRLNIYLGEAAASGKKRRAPRLRPDTDRFAYLAPDHKGFETFFKLFPKILNLVFTKRQTNGEVLKIYDGFVVGTVTVDKRNAVVIVQAEIGQKIACFNRKIDGRTPNPHKNGVNTVQFVLDSSRTITQKCWNSSTSSNRAAGCPCCKWGGYMVDIQEELDKTLNPKLPVYEEQKAKVDKIVTHTIPEMMREAMEDCMKPLPSPADEMQRTLDARVMYELSATPSPSATPPPPPMRRTPSFVFGGGSSRTSATPSPTLNRLAEE